MPDASVNPESRVRERSFNATINNAQIVYLNDPTEKNRSVLKAEIEKAFRTTYDIRLKKFAQAEVKGIGGADALFVRITDSVYRQQQLRELTEQRNLYGRIDRMVTFGCNTAENWSPCLQAESRRLATLLRQYDASPNRENRRTAKAVFDSIYTQILALYEKRLSGNGGKLNVFIEETLQELIN